MFHMSIRALPWILAGLLIVSGSPLSSQNAAAASPSPARPSITLPEDAVDCERESTTLLPPEPEAVSHDAPRNDQVAYHVALNELDKAEFSQACKSHGTAGTLIWLRNHLRGGNYGDLPDPQFNVLRPGDGHIVLYQSAISLGGTPVRATVHDQLDVRSRVYPQNDGPKYLFALLHYRNGKYRLLPLNYASPDISPGRDIPVGELDAAYDARADKYLLYISQVLFFTTPTWDSSIPSWEHYYVWSLDPKKGDMRRVLLPPGPWVSDAKLDFVLARVIRNFSCGVDCYRHAEIKSIDGGDIYVTVTGQSSAIREAVLGTYRLKMGESSWVKQ